ncbi:MAG: hypothetical protein OHK0039_24630 [Bacteroidia bacterium]
MTSQPIVEWAQAVLRPEVTEETFLALSEIMQRSFIDQQPGVLSRQVFAGQEGRVGAMLVWESEAALRASLAAARTDAAVRAFADCLVPGSYTMQVLRLLQTY